MYSYLEQKLSDNKIIKGALLILPTINIENAVVKGFMVIACTFCPIKSSEQG